MWPNPQFPPDLVTFTGEILNRKLHFLRSDLSIYRQVIDLFMHMYAQHNDIMYDYKIIKFYMGIWLVQNVNALCNSNL